MIIAVLAKRARAPIGNQDVYLSTVGGVRLTEPASDLAVALAIASAVMDRPLADHSIAFGELGLAGELRPVTGIPRRLAEAARLGFRTAYVPTGVLGGGPVPEGMHVVECDDIRRAVGAALPAAPG
jgi:DNA repair protein RadA/Sms